MRQGSGTRHRAGHEGAGERVGGSRAASGARFKVEVRIPNVVVTSTRGMEVVVRVHLLKEGVAAQIYTASTGKGRKE